MDMTDMLKVFENTDKKVTLLNVVVNDRYTDASYGLTLTATYQVEYPNGSISDITIPRIRLPFKNDKLPEIGKWSKDIITCDAGFGPMSMLPNYNGFIWTETIVKAADPKEMTLAEIEKQLGYPVKIVKEK